MTTVADSAVPSSPPPIVGADDARHAGLRPNNLVTRAAVLALLLGGLAGSGAAAQGVSGVALTGATAPHLWIEVNGRKLDNHLSMALPDTMVVTVNPRDSLGNLMAVTGFEAQVWDQAVLGSLGWIVEPTRAIARFVPRKRGQTTIQIRASGLRQWIRVEVGRTTLAVAPLRNAPAAQGARDAYSTPTAGGRVSYAAYEHTFTGKPPSTPGTGSSPRHTWGATCGDVSAMESD